MVCRRLSAVRALGWRWRGPFRAVPCVGGALPRRRASGAGRRRWRAVVGGCAGRGESTGQAGASSGSAEEAVGWAGLFSTMACHESVWDCLQGIGRAGRWGLTPTRNPGSDSVFGRGGPPFVETAMEGSRPQMSRRVCPCDVTDLEGFRPQTGRDWCACNATVLEGSRPQRLGWICLYIATAREGLRPQTAWMRSGVPLHM